MRRVQAWTKRLYDVVIGAELQADDTVDFGGARREKEDRRLRQRADSGTKFEAAHVGKADVENNKRYRLRSE